MPHAYRLDLKSLGPLARGILIRAGCCSWILKEPPLWLIDPSGKRATLEASPLLVMPNRRNVPDAAVRALRAHAVDGSLVLSESVGHALDRLGFVQADPIQSPARAHDLILRQRVSDYRVGDLERQYRALELEEDRLYAFGFMPQSTWRLLHPKAPRRLTASEQRVLEFVLTRGCVHPDDVDSLLSRRSARNAWGGRSRATTLALQSLYHNGRLRVAGRENGIRIYEAVAQRQAPLPPDVRLRGLAMKVASILGPLPERSLRATLAHVARRAPNLKGLRSVVSELVRSGELASRVVDGIRYLWPSAQAIPEKPNETVRFLAPFDPIVWDRQRFEHLWGWAYRFEAYTPVAKRKRGHYAMPMLWRHDVIGWVNVARPSGGLVVEPGFTRKPRDPCFAREFEAEVGRLAIFLQSRAKAGAMARDSTSREERAPLRLVALVPSNQHPGPPQSFRD